jgi:superfamily II DNA or RNA helicase
MEHRETDHPPVPARFALLYGEQHKDKSARILELFNSDANVDGSLLRIIVGSRFIRESLDFKEVRHLVIMQQPYNIPMLIQIIGRGIREGSHIRLPEKQRKVKLYIPVSPLGEIEDYRVKLREYAEVQRYERIINHLAIDSSLYFGTPEDFERNVKEKTILLPSLGIPSLPFEAVLVAPSGKDDITYNAFQYFKYEVMAIDALVRQAFRQSIVWKFEELVEFVKTATYTPNPKFFDENNIVAVIKRNQYMITDGYVIPRGVADIDSIFVENTPKLQRFHVDSTAIMSQNIID